MHSALATFLVSLASFTALTFGQSAPPLGGYQLSNSTTFDIITPLAVGQCEPVLIYYNITSEPTAHNLLRLLTPAGDLLVTFDFPDQIGYLTWICNIPVGADFVAQAELQRLYTVLPGSSSDCLGDVTTTYSALQYNTTVFQSYTESPDIAATTALSELSILPYPTSSFSTLTANPDLVSTSTAPPPPLIASPTPPSSSSTASAAAPPPLSPLKKKSKKAVIAGSVTGVVFFFILVGIAVIYYVLQKKRRSRDGIRLEPSMSAVSPPTATRVLPGTPAKTPPPKTAVLPGTKSPRATMVAPATDADDVESASGSGDFTAPVVASSSQEIRPSFSISSDHTTQENAYRDSPLLTSIASAGDTQGGAGVSPFWAQRRG